MIIGSVAGIIVLVVLVWVFRFIWNSDDHDRNPYSSTHGSGG